MKVVIPDQKSCGILSHQQDYSVSDPLDPTALICIVTTYVAKSQLTLEFPRILDRFLCTCLPFSVIVHTTPGQQSIMR